MLCSLGSPRLVATHPAAFRGYKVVRRPAKLMMGRLGQASVSASPDGTSSIWDDIDRRYREAQASQASSSIETHASLVHDAKTGVNFVLQVAAKLQKKPANSPKEGERDKMRTAEVWQTFCPPKDNPFLPYDERLWVRHLSPTHTLLLNKFNVLPRHVLSVTREFAGQSLPLDRLDFEALWEVLRAAPEPGALAFFNSGPPAGASQMHRHFQIVPLPLVPGIPEGPPLNPAVLPAWQLAKRFEVVPLRGFPFKSWAVKLSQSAPEADYGAEDVFEAYIELCRVSKVFGPLTSPLSADFGQTAKSLRHLWIDYNLLLTKDYIQLVPRSREKVEDFTCNALAFAGTFFARSEETLELLRRKRPMGVLLAVGFPWERGSHE